MRLVINAGHTKLGKGTGANGYLNESIETRKIAYELMKLLADTSHEVIPAVYDKSSDNLKEVVTLANNKNADLLVSIHLNATGGAGRGQGCEVYTWRGNTTTPAVKTCENLSNLGFKNRGVKDGSKYYLLKNTKPSVKTLLIEVCFLDNKQDVELYKQLGYTKVAQAIYNAIKGA